MFHLVRKATWWPPRTHCCCSTTRGDWKQTLVAGKEHPAIGVLQIERMTKEHIPYCAGIMLFGRARTRATYCWGSLREAPRNTVYYWDDASRKLHGDETDLCQYHHDNDRHPLCWTPTIDQQYTSRMEQQEHSVNKNWSEEATVTICDESS